MTEFIDKSAGFIAQHNFECNGRKYTSGDAFDATGLTDRELERLFRYRRIRNGGAPVATVASEPEQPTATVEPVTTATVAPLLEPEQPTTGVEFVRNGPWYNVVCGGVVLNTDGAFKGLKAAQEWAEANGIK